MTLTEAPLRETIHMWPCTLFILYLMRPPLNVQIGFITLTENKDSANQKGTLTNLQQGRMRVKCFQCAAHRSVKFISLVELSARFRLTDEKQPFSRPVIGVARVSPQGRTFSRFHFLRNASSDRWLLTVMFIQACV